MAYPTAGDYQQALQVPEVAFSDPELQHGEPEADVLGLPRAVTGAYAAVFPMQTRGGRVAVKCFLTDVADQQRRYAAVAEYLAAADVTAAVSFEYQRAGVQVEGRELPLLKMPWVSGQALNHFVEAHRDEDEVLEALGTAWLRLVEELEEAAMAHGDLQHGNVLVTGDPAAPQLQLVDFDTAYVPALKGRTSAEVGHRNYQHPDRDKRDFGPYLDRFAALVIFTALQALRIDPDLWERYDTGENLLFRATDFYDPESSVLFDELQRLDDIGPIVASLRRACLLEPEDVPALAAIVRGEVLPDAGRGPKRRRSEEGRRPRAAQPCRMLATTGAAVLVIGGALVVGGWWGGLLAGMAALGALADAWRRYRRLPRVRRRRRLLSEVAYFDALIGQMEVEEARLETERGDVVKGTAERRAERLEELREEVLYDRLKYHFVQEAAAAGLSHKVIVRLKADGLRTAHHLTPEALGQVREIGERSQKRLLAWRRTLVERYADELPDELSPAQERRLENVLRHRLRDLDAERQRVREKRRVQQEERADVAARLDRIRRLSFGRYVAELTGFVSVQPGRGRPPAPQHQPVRPGGDRQAPSDEQPPEEDSGREDEAWWRRAS